MTMSPLRALVGLLVLGACAGAVAEVTQQDAPKASTPPPAAVAGQAPARSADETAVRALIEGFVQAYRTRDADAVAALFTADARIFDESGKVTEGRKAIRDRFAAAFASAPRLGLRLEPATIRFLTPDVAVEDGVAIPLLPARTEGEPAATAPVPEPPAPSHYTATHVRLGGKWQTAEVRDKPAPTVEGRDEGDRALDELAWLVGDWIDEDDQGAVFTSTRWSDDHKYLLREFKVNIPGRRSTSGTQRIGWDPVRQKVRSWAFDSDGGFTEGSWTRVAPGHWVIKTDGFLRDGRAVSATNKLIQASPDAFRWSSIDRVVGDEARTDVEEVLIVRRPPAPTARKK